MKKLLSVLLTFVITISLINLNGYHIKAVAGTVTFDMQGHGTQVDPQSVNSGSVAIKPNDPTADGYVFDGWYTEALCTNAWDFTTPVTASTTLYAKWLLEPLTITAIEDGTTKVALKKEGSLPLVTIQYSIDNGSNWSSYTYNTDIQLAKNTSVLFKVNTVDNLSNYDVNNYIYFASDKKITASGNVMSLICNSISSATSISNDYVFCGLFTDCTKLTSIDHLVLPASTLYEACYSYMFEGCTGLTSIPENLLPATSLAAACYYNMFYGCTGLTTIPENLLPATSLSKNCYESMFSGCTGLTSIPENLLPATSLNNYCYESMFSGCTGLTSISEGLLPATSLTLYCYYNMFKGCTGLTSIPSGLLPAETLEMGCYYLMFEDCTGLTSIPSDFLIGITPASTCCYGMFKNCTNLKVSETKVGDYTIPFKVTNTNSSYTPFDTMFSGTGGTFTGTPVSGKQYYIAKPSQTTNDYKDQSCEAVIGPRWHWNDTKGVCELEGYSVINTATK